MEYPAKRGDYYAVERIEMFNMRYCNTPDYPEDVFTAAVLCNDRVEDYDNPVDVLSSVIYLSDGLCYREIYNPVKLKRFYTTVPPPMQPPPFSNGDGFQKSSSPKRLRVDSSSSGHNNNNNTDLLPLTTDRCFTDLPIMQQEQISGNSITSGHNNGLGYEIQVDSSTYPFSSNKRKSRGEFTELPIMCTHADSDITPFHFFHLIVHDSDSPFKMPYSFNDVVALWKPQCVPEFYDTLVPFKFSGSFGTVELDFILFSDSKLVKVSVEWFLEEGIDSGDWEKSLATTTETTYICGELLLSDCKFEMASVLLQTPEGKGVKLEQDNSIPLLKSVVALPYFSSFNVEANLRDPITHSNVEGNAFFHFDEFPDENKYLESVQEIDGYGAKIKVKVVMEAPGRQFDTTYL